jgi:hypothetical protein
LVLAAVVVEQRFLLHKQGDLVVLVVGKVETLPFRRPLEQDCRVKGTTVVKVLIARIMARAAVVVLQPWEETVQVLLVVWVVQEVVPH